MNMCENNTVEFHILGFSSSGREQLLLCVGVLVMYFLTIFGNLLITTLVCMVSKLHTPMYFFLCNLSIVDVTYVSTTLPQLVSITVTHNNKISFQSCITQMFFFTFCAVCDIFVLTSMAYDRYVAVCKPLQYTLIMSKRVCSIMAVCCWLVSAMNSFLLSMLTSVLSFCNSHNINHFFCDIKTLIALSTSDTTSIEFFILVEDIVFALIPFSVTITSYVYIISTILKINTSRGRLKAFSSCTSHLTTVILFYGSMLFVYIKPESDHSKEQDNLISMIYVAVVPMLNPFVYTLRNKDVIGAHKKLFNLKGTLSNS